MKRIFSILTIALCQVIAFAQRGKVRPELDFDGGHNVLRHDTNDDMWSFLLIIGAVALFFLYYYIKENSKRSSKNNNFESNSYGAREEIEYSGEYTKMGYSSSMPIEDEEIQSENDDTIAVALKESNYDKWTDTGKTYNLRDFWEFQDPGLYDLIEGDLAEVVSIEFASGERALRIRIPIKNGKYKELKLRKSKLEEGDKVEISSIMGYEMSKKGSDPIIRFDGDLFYTTIVSPVERDLAEKDKYGIKYSTDSKRLLYASPSIKDFSIRSETVVICDKAFFMSKNIVSVVIPKSIRKIGDEAFAFCPNLSIVCIPNSVLEIGNGVFTGSDGLTKILIPRGSKKKFEQILPEYKDILMEQSEDNNSDKSDEDNNEQFEEAIGTEQTWEPFGEAYNLKEIWEVQFPDKDLYNEIDGDTAEVVAVEFPDGNIALRLEIPLKDGSNVRLKLANVSDYDEGDKVIISTIVGQEFHKEGHAPIVRFSGVLFSTYASKDDMANAWTDEFGVKYSQDRVRLLKAPDNLQKYSIKSGTIIICDKAFSKCKELQSVQIPDSVIAIGDFAFYNCVRLSSAILPKSVNNIGMSIFEGCERMPNYHPFE